MRFLIESTNFDYALTSQTFIKSIVKENLRYGSDGSFQMPRVRMVRKAVNAAFR